MSGDLQATLEISVELSTFHNVDLFQRGYYQIRCSLKPPEKSVTCIDVEYRRTNGDYQPDDCLYPALVTPTGLTAVSKTFQILYKNEEVILADPFIFRLNMLVDSNKLTDQIDQADVQLLVELYFSDAEVGPESPDSLVSVSSQILKLHLSSIKGLHHHVPILFDYFHFAVIDTTIHAVLVKLSLPDPSILKIPKSSWFSKASANTRVPTPLFYAKLFGNKPIDNVLSTRTPAEERQIRFAYDTHRSLCSTLLSVQVNLLAYFECLSEFLPESQKIQIGSLDFGQRLDSLLLSIESIQNANEVFSQICSDLDNISIELSLVWSQFLESFILNKQVLPHFRDEHHRQRIGHLSEAFFVQEFPWDELQISQEQSYQIHQSLGQGIKNSRYYQTIPAVAVECPALDGDTSSTPIIFEDKFIFTSIHEGASCDSDLEKIELSVGIDGFEIKNAVEDEIVNIETDINDVPASKDDPNSSFPLSGMMCNGERAVRETMILDDDLDDGNSNLSKALQEIIMSQQQPESSFALMNNAEDEKSSQDCKDYCSVEDNFSECKHLITENLCSVGSLSVHSNVSDCPILQSNENGQICKHETVCEQFTGQYVTDDVHGYSSAHKMNVEAVNMDIATIIEINKSEDTTATINEKTSIDQGNEQNLPEEKIEQDIPENANEFQKIDSQTRIGEKEIIDEKSERTDEKDFPEKNCQTISTKNINSENQNETNGQKTQTEQITNNKESLDVEMKMKESDNQRAECENNEAIASQESWNGTILEKQKGMHSHQNLDEPLNRNVNLAIETERDDQTNLESHIESSETIKVLDENIGNGCDYDTSEEKEIKTNDQESHKQHEETTVSEYIIQDSRDELVPLQLNREHVFRDKQSSTSDLDNPHKTEDVSIRGSEFEDSGKEPTAKCDKSSNQDDAPPNLATDEAQSYSKISMQEEKETLIEPVLYKNTLSENEKNLSGEIPVLDEKLPENCEMKQSSSVVTFVSAKEGSTSSSSLDSPSRDSVYETPGSSRASFLGQSDVDGNDVVQKQRQQEKKQSPPQSINKKGKKKAHQKGLMITGCLPVNCSGNTSPSFTRGNSVYGGSVKSRFELAKRYMKRQLKFSCQIYSDIGLTSEREPYFSKDKVDRGLETHLIVCVHGLDGNSGDLRLFKCYLEMALPSTRIDFLMSEINQGDTFVSFEELTDRLVQEILHYIDAYSIFPSKISFVGHSLGNIIIRSALAHPCMQPLLDRMHTFLSLSGPHVGMLYPTSPLVSTGLWLMQKWKKSEALTQLSLNDHEDLRQTCIYRLSRSKGLEYFKNVLLVSSVQDHYVPYHSARIEICKAASKDTSEYGTIYREMISNLLSPLKDKENMTFIRYSCYHALNSSANSFIGRAAHIAMLDSELFIEKLLLVSALEYFR